MPILDLQKKMAETGRIRMGEKRVSQKSGKEYPAKLDTFRLTSKHRHVVNGAGDWQYVATYRIVPLPVEDEEEPK